MVLALGGYGDAPGLVFFALREHELQNAVLHARLLLLLVESGHIKSAWPAAPPSAVAGRHFLGSLARIDGYHRGLFEFGASLVGRSEGWAHTPVP